MRKFISLLFIISSAIINAQNQIKTIDSIVSSKVKADHPGLAVGIVKDGEIIYENYQGLSNLQHQVKFNEKTRSNIASTAKQFTALMILELSMEGKLSLEDDLRKYLPRLYKDVDDQIKIRHLLNHTSGIRDYVELLDLEGQVWWQRFGLDNDDVMDLLKNQNDLGFEPGSRYAYSNSNYNVLTKVIEEVSGRTFFEYSNDFFAALGMNETVWVERYMGVIPNRANPYSDWGRGEWWEVPTVTKTCGEGFLFTTLKDQLIYEKALQNASKNNNELLIKSQGKIPNSEITTYGFGLELGDKLGRKAIHHSGGTYGFHSQVYRFPDDGLTIFAMSNNGNISTNLIAQDIAKAILPEIKPEENYDQRLFGLVSISDKEQILGQYYSPGGYLTRIVNDDGKIYFRQGKSLKIELVPDTNNLYHFSYDEKQKIGFYENKMLLFDASGETSEFVRSSEVEATNSDIENFVGTYHNDELNISFDLVLKDKNALTLKFSNEDGSEDVEVFNKNELLAGNNYVLKAQRDIFERVTEIFLTYGRAKNIRFTKKTNLLYQPKIDTEEGTIQVTTIGSGDHESSQILLTANYPNGNEIWFKKFGGNSYDKASSILSLKDGYLIIGSTSSFGNGNYDMFVIKTDKKGNKIWQNTYGGFYNEYGYSAEITDTGFVIKGTIQDCENNYDINRKCTTNVWFVTIDKEGNEKSNTILEEINS